MAMDFFRNCTTNVHVVENFAQTRFTAYGWETKDDQTRWRDIQNTLVRLREKNILCAASGDEVWVFGDMKIEAPESQNGEQAYVSDTGSLASDSNRATANGTPIRDILLEAIEGALAFALARDKQMMHVGSRTWLYSENDEDDPPESSLIRLHPKVALNGALHLISEITTTSLSSLSSTTTGSKVLLAPCNKNATVVPAEAPKIISDDAWKDNVSLAMRTHGILLGESSEWVPVRPSDSDNDVAFLWPVKLCIAYQPCVKASTLFGDERDWRPWFATTDDVVSYRNPLAIAEEWYQSASERNRSSQAENAPISTTNANTVPVASNDTSSTISPPMNQRLLDQQAAMAGIYPTPPDGLATGPQGSQFNQATTPSVTQADTALSGNDILPTSDDSQGKANDAGAMIGLDGYPMEQEDLFGDVGQMQFEENDIGDADFNFFDDQPDEAPSLDLGEDTLMLEAPSRANTIDAPTAHSIEEHIDIAKNEESNAAPGVSDVDPQADDSKRPIGLDEEPENQQEKDIKEEPPGNTDQTSAPLEKPLSPFGIREKLLPPPVPASLALSDAKEAEGRRNSVFSPISFRDHSILKARYAVDESRLSSTRPASNPGVVDISMPKTRKKSRTLSRELVKQPTGEESESEEDSFESSSSESEPDLPPKMPWDNKKRKRHSEQDLAQLFPDSLDPTRLNGASAITTAHLSLAEMKGMLNTYLVPNSGEVHAFQPQNEDCQVSSHSSPPEDIAALDRVAILEDNSEIRREDLIYIAEVISQQAVTMLSFMRSSAGLLCEEHYRHTTTPPATPRKLLHQSLDAILPGIELCDLPKIAVSREPAPPPRAMSTPGKAPQSQVPRPPQRADSMMNAPDHFALQAPYVKIQRGAEDWEMLPTCLSFWETLGLGPANGPKDVRAFCVYPDNDDLQNLVEHFLADIGTAYEGCKLGSHTHLRNVVESERDDCFEDGMAPVELENNSFEGALKAYTNTCVDLGKTLAGISHKEADRTTVIYMINPFPQKQAIHHLCACFYQLFSAYRDNIPKAHPSQSGSDVVLQLIPISLIAAPDMLVLPDAKDLAMLAREVYDRCPPSTAYQSADNTSNLPIIAAPSVELAGSAPRKIGFQLAPEPPSDLLHEGSILHLAYAISKDGLWMTVVWVDNTSQYQSSASFCLRGRTFADAAQDAWDQTREILAARQVTWRVFIVTHQPVDKSISQCWRAISCKPRPQSLCVTFVTVQLDPLVQLSPPTPADNPGFLDGGFLTPATTPQAANFTSSPDVSGSGPALSNAPPTPAPSETAFAMAENDPDAHLIDLTDETWGVLLSPKLVNVNDVNVIATGALYRRGEEGRDAPLGSLGVIINWTIQVKPTGAVDEGSSKQGELTLREILRMYRNLALLTKARGLEGDLKGPVPVHVVAAMRGSRALEGMLRKGLNMEP